MVNVQLTIHDLWLFGKATYLFDKYRVTNMGFMISLLAKYIPIIIESWQGMVEERYLLLQVTFTSIQKV